VKTDAWPIGHKNPKVEEITTKWQLRELVSVPSESFEEAIEKASEIVGF
jgi:hypothetical protein